MGHFYAGDNIKAFELYQQAKDSALIHGDSLQYGYSLNNIGRLYFNQGNYALAYNRVLSENKKFGSVLFQERLDNDTFFEG